MTIRVHDRLGAFSEARSGAALLGRFVMRDGAPGGLFLNSLPVQDGMFLVPESSGRWGLLRDSERVQGLFPRAQMLDPLDIASIISVGRSLSDLIEKGGTWLDVFDVSPLVPGMSSRADLQPLEQLLNKNIGHIEEVCRRPRTNLRVEIERVAVSRARRFPPQAANFLAAHTEDWERPTLRSVLPKRILATVRDEQFDIYENRVAVRLVDHLVVYLRRRVLEVTRLLRVFEEASGNHGAAAGGSYWRQRRIYKIWGKALDASEVMRKAERTLGQLNYLLFKISGLKDSVLYREVPRRSSLGTTLTMTNVLRDDVHYRRVAETWLEWARLGQMVSNQPRAHFEEMQALCRSFDSFALLLTLRALDQLGFEPSDLERSLSEKEAEVRRGARIVRLTWDREDGAIWIQGDGVEPLRIVPLCSSLAALDADFLRDVIEDADRNAPRGVVTVVLYPAPSEAGAAAHLHPEHASRLQSLSHEVSTSASRSVGFLPVSPWDIGSVERMARLLRWVTTVPTFLQYPPSVQLPAAAEIFERREWFTVDGDQLRIHRAPTPGESLPVARLIEEAVGRIEKFEEEHEEVSLALREAVRGRDATAELNARKRSLNGSITEAQGVLMSRKAFQGDLHNALRIANDLLQCPTCGELANARHEFKPMGKHFRCTCLECKTIWGTMACRSCANQVPMIRLHGFDRSAVADAPGWVDRILGADVLAVPVVNGTLFGFRCPSCGANGL